MSLRCCDVRAMSLPERHLMHQHHHQEEEVEEPPLAAPAPAEAAVRGEHGRTNNHDDNGKLCRDNQQEIRECNGESLYTRRYHGKL